MPVPPQPDSGSPEPAYGKLRRLCVAANAAARRHPRWCIGLGIGAVMLYSAFLLIAGAVAQKFSYPERILDRIRIHFTSARDSDSETVTWSEKFSNIHTLQIAKIDIGNGLGWGGGLAEASGNIIFSSAKGRFGYLDTNHRLHPLEFTVPMNLSALRANPHYSDPLYAYSSIRVAGLLAVQQDPTHFTLYVSHHYFKQDCIQFKVSSIQLAADPQGVRASDPTWKEVYVARPNCIRDKDKSWHFVGEQAGGRLALLDSNTLLVSVGDHQFDGFNDARSVSMDPDTDLGKIIAVNLNDKSSRIFASGIRNPQGLTITRDGRIWETEHGPQGGDEVNLIIEGNNYGWPKVTYGMNYGYPRRYWPFDPEPGGHDGYAKPAFAFVPSIGISNIVEPNETEFPDWHHILIVSSLRAGSLFVLRTEGDRIVYSEPIYMDGDRVRDIVSLHNGELAYLSDSGKLVLVRNAERHTGNEKSFSVTGLTSLSKPFPEEFTSAEGSPVDRGRHMFISVCGRCHKLDGTVGAGPPLNGVVGRRVGSVPGFTYSSTLANYDGPWTSELLVSFLTDPDRKFHGTAMPIAPISWAEVPNIVRFLETTQPGRSESTK